MAKDDIHLEQLDNVTLNAFALGQLFEVRRETVARWAKVEGMPKASRGKYHLIECAHWRLEIERGNVKGETPVDKKARMEVSKEQALRYRIENAKNLNELLPADLVQAAVNQMASALASQLDGLAPRMAAELSQIDDPAVIQRKLFDECRGIRDSAAAAFAAIASDTDSQPDTQTAAKPKRGRVGRRRKSATAEQPGAG